MTDKCPNCGARCSYDDDDLGRTIRCGHCEATLSVRADGLHLVTGSSSAAREPSGGTKSADHPTLLVRLTVWCFLAGLLLVLLFLFLPVIDRARAQSADARILDGEREVKKMRLELDAKYRDKEDEFDEQAADLKDQRQALDARGRAISRRWKTLDRFGNDKRFDKEAFERAADDRQKEIASIQTEQRRLDEDNKAYQEKMDKIEEGRANLRKALRKEHKSEETKYRKALQDWQRKKDLIEIDRQAAEAGALERGYWYNWGMLIGLLLLSAASLGFLAPQQPLVRRILGAIVIAAVILLIVNRYTGGRGLLPLLTGGSAGLGRGLSAYDFSTPKSALTSDLSARANMDFKALIELDNKIEGPRVREKLATMRVHREADWDRFRLLFISYREDGRARQAVEGFERDQRSGMWRPRYVADYQMEQTNPVLAREVRSWRESPALEDGRPSSELRLPRE
jgi:hypothetical protein